MAKLSKDYADNPQAAIRALMKCATPADVEEFMVGEKRKSIQKEAQALISKLIHASELPEMQIDKGGDAGATEGIDKIMEWRDRADKIGGNQDKFTFALPVKLSIVREVADFAIKVRITPGAKQKIEREGSVHIANPDNDLADMADAKNSK